MTIRTQTWDNEQERPSVASTTSAMVNTWVRGTDMAEITTPCVETTWGRDRGGYGTTTRLGKHWFAHRYAWTQANGPIPAGLNVLHRCDNPPCINLDHLFLGTHADNVADKEQKGRGPQGEANGKAKLNAADVVSIRASLAAGETQRSIAARYGMSQGAIAFIATGKNWRSVA